MNPMDEIDAALSKIDGSIEARARAALDDLPESLVDAVLRLAKLPALEYEQVRETEATRLNVRVGALDKEVSIARREQHEDGGKAAMFKVVMAWHEPVSGAVLLDELYGSVKRHIVCRHETAVAAALWIVFTHLIEHFDVAPIALITAPEKRCGKTQLLNLLGRLVRRPLVASNISPAAVYRVIEAHAPTLLIDEADAFMRDNEELRGVINSGHTRQSAYVIRTVGDDHEPRQFSTWGAKAISGIGHQAETIMDRSVVLELRRKLPSEDVERLRHADPAEFDRLAAKLARYAEDAGQDISRSRPSLPDALHDRAQDNWEPLIAIADHAGGNWPRLARDAALKISGTEQEAVSLSAELLADIREVFEVRRADRLSTSDLLQDLTDDELKPWATYNRGRPMAPRQLAKRLDEYHIKSRDMRFGYDIRKGYELSQFTDAFARYLSPTTPPNSSATPQQPRNHGGSSVADGKPLSQQAQQRNTADVADKGQRCGNENEPATEEAALIRDCCGVADMGTVEVEV